MVFYNGLLEFKEKEVLRTTEKERMGGGTKKRMCHVPPSPLTQRPCSVPSLVPRFAAERPHMRNSIAKAKGGHMGLSLYTQKHTT
jgi:hypothetical protein